MNAIRAFNFLFLLGMIGGGKKQNKKKMALQTQSPWTPGVLELQHQFCKEFIALNT